MPFPVIDETSPGYIMSQMSNTIAHDIIQNDTKRLSQMQELKFFTNQLRLQKYGQIYVRVAMATLIADICGNNSVFLETWNATDWDGIITEFSHLYKVLIRKDACQFFVSGLLEKEGTDFETDTVAFQKDQKSFKNRNVDMKLKKQTSTQFREIMAKLKFQKIFSIIRSRVKDLLNEKDEGELTEESALPDDTAQLYMDGMHALFDDCQDAKEALVSLVSRQEENGDTFELYLKKPSELKELVKDTNFRKHNNMQNFQDRFEYIVRSWEDMVLPLPKIQTIGDYTIPEVRLAETNDDENENDSAGDIDFSDENDETDDDQDQDQDVDQEQDQFFGSNNQGKEHDPCAEDDDDCEPDGQDSNFHTNDETTSGTQLDTHPPFNNDDSGNVDSEEEKDDNMEAELETEPPSNSMEAAISDDESNRQEESQPQTHFEGTKPALESSNSDSDNDEEMDGRDGQLETQPRLAQQRSEDDLSFGTAE